MGKKIQSEAESRENLIGWARLFGRELEMKRLFAYWDGELAQSKSPEQRQVIAAQALTSLDNFFGGKGEFCMQNKAPPPPPQEKR